MIRPTLKDGIEFLVKRNNMKKKPILLQIILNEQSCDTLQKMLLGYCLMMPMNEPDYQGKLQSTVEFLEECLTQHPGAFAAYFKLLDKFPAVMVRHIPEGMMDFIAENLEEIEKYYGGPIPAKYKPKSTIIEGVNPDKVILGADGTPTSSTEAKKLILV